MKCSLLKRNFRLFQFSRQSVATGHPVYLSFSKSHLGRKSPIESPPPCRTPLIPPSFQSPNSLNRSMQDGGGGSGSDCFVRPTMSPLKKRPVPTPRFDIYSANLRTYQVIFYYYNAQFGLYNEMSICNLSRGTVCTMR